MFYKNSLIPFKTFIWNFENENTACAFVASKILNSTNKTKPFVARTSSKRNKTQKKNIVVSSKFKIIITNYQMK